MVDLELSEVGFELAPGVLDPDGLPVPYPVAVVAYLLLVLVYEVEEDIRDILVLVELHHHFLMAVPSREPMPHFLHRALQLECAHSCSHGEAVEFVGQVHAQLEFDPDSVRHKGFGVEFDLLLAIAVLAILRMLLVLLRLDVKTFLERGGVGFEDGLEQHGAGVVRCQIRVDRVHVFVLVVLAFDLGAVEVYPELLIIPPTALPLLTREEPSRIALSHQLIDRNVAASHNLLGFEHVGVDESQDDVVDVGRQVHWYFESLVPLRIEVVDHSLRLFVDHSEL